MLGNISMGGIKINFSIFDFGGAGRPNVLYGVKIKDGRKLLNYCRYNLVHYPIKI